MVNPPDETSRFDDLMRQVRTRWPDATQHSVVAALQSRDPVLPDLYEHARAELDALAEDNPQLRALLAELARGGEAR